jgi:preprotein translocase subunit SecG
MYEAIVIIIIIACLLLIGVVLIQNPKGGGLSQAFGGLSSQFMGVKRTTDFLEKTTWGLIGAVAILSLFTVFFINRNAGTKEKPKSQLEGMDMTMPQQQQPAQQQKQSQPQQQQPAQQQANQPAQQQPKK